MKNKKALLVEYNIEQNALILNLLPSYPIIVLLFSLLCYDLTVLDSYEDLKPPTSPIPTQPSGKKENVNSVEAVSMLDTLDPSPASASGIAETKPAPVETKTARPLSPYVAYDDLKPPTSPSPTAPVGLVATTTSINAVPKTGNNAPPTAAIDNQHHKEPNPRPLSPYPMYEDLKPPASPTPSLKL
ncbi:hypothetical protein POTOM_033316 [Populus tomentosa]|uniref:Uncharacterized protein n=1 Tax=Populus tomentosa TaxID=118781 RepID=A0A8X7Z1T5_POPTO|nr:hypothetical protein POTOM_033316 [Populus tomentosa]